MLQPEDLDRLRAMHIADQALAEDIAIGDMCQFGASAMILELTFKGWTRIMTEEIGKIIWRSDQERRDFTAKEKEQIRILSRNISRIASREQQGEEEQ